MSDSSFITAALLYSPRSKDSMLTNVIDKINTDPILSKRIRLISTDSSHVQDLLHNNESGVSVKKWPVFAVKVQKAKIPTLYPLTSFDDVFKLFRSIQTKVAVTHPIKEEKLITSVSRDSLEAESMLITRRRLVSKGEVVVWNSDSFSDSISEINISDDSIIHFQSNDNMIHDVTLTDSYWKPLRRLIPRQKNLDQEIVIDDQLLKTIEKGQCRVISSLPQDHQMRLVLRLIDPSDEIIDGITDVKISNNHGHFLSNDKRYLSDCSPEYNLGQVEYKNKFNRMTFAQRRLEKLQ